MTAISRLRFCPSCPSWRHPLSTVLGLAALWGLSCGGGSTLPPDTLPADWTGARALAVGQSACGGDALASPKQPRLQLTDSGGTLAGVYKDAEFRCGPQKACAYVQDTGAVARVLVQPCDLHPTTVPRCDCLYEITFTLPARDGRTAVELYHRWDYYGSTGPVAPMLVDTQPVGAPALRWYDTCGDPICRSDDGGASDDPDGGAPACTSEKAGEACTTSGTTCDPGAGCGVLLRCADRDPRVQTGGCPISRRAAKRDIAYLDDAALEELSARLRAVRLARYRYKDAPARQRLGFIIDDGNGGPAIDAVRDQIDLYSYLSWTVGALQAQMKRIDVQERQIAALRARLARRELRLFHGAALVVGQPELSSKIRSAAAGADDRSTGR